MIKSLQVENLRSLTALNIDFDAAKTDASVALSSSKLSPSLILFYGANAQGKTSILESLHLLLTGRSFKTAILDQLIGTSNDHFVVSGSISIIDQGEPFTHRLGILKRKKSKILVSKDGAAVRSAMELARLIPVQVIDHQSLQLILGEPGVRRRFLDWGVFHVERDYGPLMKKWQVSLTQRNASLKALKRNADSSNELQLRAWTDTFTLLSIKVARVRERYFQAFTQFLTNAEVRSKSSVDPSSDTSVMPGIPHFALKLKHGFRFDAAGTDEELADYFKSELASKRDFEVMMGRTYSGPQRADLIISVDEHSAKNVLSRGQCKMASAILLLRQVQHLRVCTADSPAVTLVDDLTAELDEEHSSDLLAQLLSSCSQLFVTALAGRIDELPRFLSVLDTDPHVAMFHVEHGSAGRLTGLS